MALCEHKHSAQSVHFDQCLSQNERQFCLTVSHYIRLWCQITPTNNDKNIKIITETINIMRIFVYDRKRNFNLRAFPIKSNTPLSYF